MKLSRTIFLILLLVGGAAHGQSWGTAYDKALAAIKAMKWADARAAFKEAAAMRTEDFSGPTILPGPVTDPKRWRNGSPYSPNFGAAYSAMRMGMDAPSDKDRTEALNTAATEFEALLNRGQMSKEAVYFLGGIYNALRAVDKQTKLEKRIQDAQGKFNWKVDLDIMTPEEEAAAVTAMQPSGEGGVTPPAEGVQNPTNPPSTNPNTGVTAMPSLGGRLPVITSKFALIIGNAESRMSDGALPFAGENAMLIREALVTNAGYAESNVDVVLNATAANMLSSAKALADRLPADATVFIYFAGTGVNIDGKDYLAGVDTELSTDSSTMLSKSDLYQLFMQKGARVFSFFEANRPVVSGRYFGMEVPMVGSISQVQATIPGGTVLGFVRNNKPVGVFASAFAGVLADFRSNRVPIQEFGWQVYYKMRKGDTGYVGGGSTQTPTLPVLTNIAADARF